MDMMMPPKNGLWFDIAAFLANVLLAWPLASLVKRTQGEDPFFGSLLVASAFLHAIGAYFKRRPMHARMAAQNTPEMGGYGYLLFITLATMHYGVFVTCVSVGFLGLDLKWLRSDTATFTAVGIGLIPTVMALAALVPPRVAEPPSAALRQRERLGDGFLFLSIVIILAWWDGFWVEYIVSANKPNIIMSAMLVLGSITPFAMFYLAPRMVLLREDYKRRQTWINAALVMSPLAFRLLWR